MNLVKYPILILFCALYAFEARGQCQGTGIHGALQIDPILCYGQPSGAVNFVLATGANPLTYKIDNISQSVGLFVNRIYAGNHIATLLDGNGCTDTLRFNIIQPDSIRYTFFVDSVKCKGTKTGRIIYNAIFGTQPYHYQWSSGVQDTFSTDTVFAGNYTISLTDANGCRSVASTSVGEPDSVLTARISQTAAGCFGLRGSVATASHLGGTGSTFYYRWTFGQNTPSITNLSQGMYNLTVTDSKYCTATDSLFIKNKDSIAVYQHFTKPRCYGFNDGKIVIDSVRGGFGNGVLSNFRYAWNTSPQQTGSQALGLIGGYEYRVTVTDTAGCFGFTSVVIPQAAPIRVSIVAQNPKCFGDSTGTITANPSGSFANNWRYQWSANARNDTNQTVSNLKGGVRYTVRVTDSTGCVVDTALTLSQPFKLAWGQNKIINNKCSTETNASIETVMLGGTPAYQYNWSNGGTNSGIHSLGNTRYFVTVTDINNCMLKDSFLITSPPPVFVRASQTPVKCFGGKDGTITAFSGGGVGPYIYSLDAIIFNSQNVFDGLKSGYYTISSKDDNGCTNSTFLFIDQPVKFTLSNEEFTIVAGQTKQLYSVANNAQGAVRFQWKPPYDSILTCKICPNPIASPSFTVKIDVTGTDTAGCVAKAYNIINVDKPRELVVPTGFSPNSDNVNDKLIVHGRPGAVIKVFRIFNRWGETVYEAQNFQINDPNYGWDGRFRGLEIGTGVFFWYLEAEFPDGEILTYKGNTSLIR
jgi:gliding motility-associated-like protein